MNDLDLEMELNLHNEINEAIMEEDVMDLRAKLEAIDIPSTPKEKRKSRFQGNWRIAAASMILLWVNRLNPAGCIDPQQLSCTNFQMHGGKTKTTTCTALQRLNHPSKRTYPGCCNLLERLLISPCTERVSPQTHPIGRADWVEKAQYFVKHLQRQRATGIGHAGPL